MMLKVNFNTLEALQLKQLRVNGCILSAIDLMTIEQLNITLGGIYAYNTSFESTSSAVGVNITGGVQRMINRLLSDEYRGTVVPSR